jgi:hypothetical protein
MKSMKSMKPKLNAYYSRSNLSLNITDYRHYFADTDTLQKKFN